MVVAVAAGRDNQLPGRADSGPWWIQDGRSSRPSALPVFPHRPGKLYGPHSATAASSRRNYRDRMDKLPDIHWLGQPKLKRSANTRLLGRAICDLA